MVCPTQTQQAGNILVDDILRDAVLQTDVLFSPSEQMVLFVRDVHVLNGALPVAAGTEVDAARASLSLADL